MTDQQRFACLGWGSLVWDARTLRLNGDWNVDGPKLPIEFARHSLGDRITLVVTNGAAPVAVLWAYLQADSLDAAIEALRVREGINEKYIERDIGWSFQGKSSKHIGGDEVARWATDKGIDGTVWTALGPKFGGKALTPSAAEVVKHLQELCERLKPAAEKYVRLAPRQIRTAYREAIEKELGWLPPDDTKVSEGS